jgi:sialic acid synthase SpsE
MIGTREVGPGHPCFIIAEAGSNHNGSLDTAKALIDAAAQAGVDAVKFQAFQASKHYSRHTPNFTYLDSQGRTKSTYALIESLEINRDWHPELITYCQTRNVIFLSSPCDDAAVEQLGDLGMPAFKLASFDLPDVRLIRKMARYGRPLIMSTGLADYSDIESGIRAAAEEGNRQVVLLQCTSLYPAPVDLSNLAAIATMHQAFNVPVGYSDHTLGDHVCLAAVALGACVIEKHFTLDRSMPGPDHSFAIEPDELVEMVKRIRDVEISIGDGVKNGPRPPEMEMYEKARRSIHTTRPVKAGEAITADMICVKRPGYGISPRLIDQILGMTARVDIPADHWVTWEAFK